MEKRARLTTKGQVTIPLEIRRVLGVQTGDDVIFEATEAGVNVRPWRRESPLAKFRGIGNPGIGSGKAAVVKAIRSLRGT